jgi:hypothetical protein
VHANFGELRQGEVRRIYLLRASVDVSDGVIDQYPPRPLKWLLTCLRLS